MSKQIYFKFKSSLKKQMISFEGSSLSASELKLAILKICSLTNCDLILIINDTINNVERECSDSEQISAFSTVTVIRKPKLNNVRNSKTINPENFIKSDPYKNMNNPKMAEEALTNLNLADSDMTEDEKLDSVIKYGCNNFNMKSEIIPKGKPPLSYTCNKCGIQGHWIQVCPGIIDKNGKVLDFRTIKRPSGIPVGILKEVDENTPNSYLTSDGRYVVNTKNQEAVLIGKKEKRPFSEEENPRYQKVEKTIPNHLQCDLCHNLLMKPVQTPCCDTVFCENCITERLFVPNTEFPMHKCPKCGEKVDKLDNLKDAEEYHCLINEWIMKPVEDSKELEITKDDDDYLIQLQQPMDMKSDGSETNVENDDDDLLNEIFTMNSEDINGYSINEIDCKEEVVESTENPEYLINSDNEEYIIKETTTQLINICQESAVEDMIKTNPNLVELIEKIVKNVIKSSQNVLVESSLSSRKEIEIKSADDNYRGKFFKEMLPEIKNVAEREKFKDKKKLEIYNHRRHPRRDEDHHRRRSRSTIEFYKRDSFSRQNNDTWKPVENDVYNRRKESTPDHQVEHQESINWRKNMQRNYHGHSDKYFLTSYQNEGHANNRNPCRRSRRNNDVEGCYVRNITTNCERSEYEKGNRSREKGIDAYDRFAELSDDRCDGQLSVHQRDRKCFELDNFGQREWTNRSRMYENGNFRKNKIFHQRKLKHSRQPFRQRNLRLGEKYLKMDSYEFQ